MRSVTWKSFMAEKSKFTTSGPSTVFTPALPKRPTSAGFLHTGLPAGQPGIAKAAGLNHSLSVGPPAGVTGTPRTTSGRAIKLVVEAGPKLLVLDVSKPEKVGVKNWPENNSATHDIFQPPKTASTKRLLPERNFCPLPTGNA